MIRSSLCNVLLLYCAFLGSSALEVIADVSCSESSKNCSAAAVKQRGASSRTLPEFARTRVSVFSTSLSHVEAADVVSLEAELGRTSGAANSKEFLEASTPTPPSKQRRLASEKAVGGVPRGDEVECSLSGQQRGSYFDDDGNTWLVTDHVLDEIKDDLQAIINCTRADDVVLFDVSTRVRPASRVFIPWSLKLGTRGGTADVEGNASVATNDVSRRTVFRCPRENEGLFVVRDAEDVLFSNFEIQQCVLRDPAERTAIIEVGDCSLQSARSRVRLRRVVFRENVLFGSPAMLFRSPQCSQIKWTNVEFVENNCSGICAADLPSVARFSDIALRQNVQSRGEGLEPILLNALAGSKVSMNRLTAVGNKGTVVRAENCSLTVSNSRFENNSAEILNAMDEVAHCVQLLNSSSQIEKFTVERNREKFGSALFGISSVVTLKNSSFVSNEAITGGVITIEEDSAVSMANCSFVANEAREHGAVVFSSGSRVQCNNSSFDDNKASGNGGIFYLESADASKAGESSVGSQERSASPENEKACQLTDCTFRNNTAASNGGSFYLRSASLIINSCHSAEGSADAGGFVYSREASSVDVDNSSFVRSSARRGGSFYSELASSLIIRNATMESSRASEDGGAIYLANNSSASISDSKFMSNEAASEGGAVYAAASRVVIEGLELAETQIKQDDGSRCNRTTGCKAGICLFDGNSGEDGGAVFLGNQATGEINGCLLRNNTADRGGSVFLNRSTTTITHCRFEKGRANSGGGFLLTIGGSASLERSVFEEGSGKVCGCICIQDQSILETENVTITACKADGRGAAMWGRNATLVVSNSVLSNNTVRTHDNSGGGGIHLFEGGSLVLKNSNLTGNEARHGGAFRLLNGVSANVSGCHFIGNRATLGGHVSVVRSSCTLTDCHFESGFANYGASLYVDNGTTAVRRSTCSNGTALSRGGCAIIMNNGSLDIDAMPMTNCTAGGDAGALFCRSCTLSVQNSVISNNTSGLGGAIRVIEAGHVLLKNATLKENSATQGGALHMASNATVDIQGCNLIQNRAEVNGGHIAAVVSTLNITDCHFKQSNATHGGSLFANSGTVTMQRSTFAEAAAAADGGCICIWQNSALFAVNVTLNACRSERSGGAIFCGNSYLNIQSSEISNSTSRLGGGILVAASGRVVVKNSILLGNSAGNGGALHLSEFTTGEIARSNFSHNSAAESGGHVYSEQSTVDLVNCLFNHGNATSGGILFTDGGSTTMIGSHFEHGTAVEGGCISSQGGNALLADNTTMRFCYSSDEGGAVWINSSTLLSTNCVYELNSAKGRGGAVSFRSVGDQRRSLQFRKTTVRNNNASYGGGLHVVTPERTAECLDLQDLCSFVAMKETIFTENRADEAGGILFASDPSAIRFSCSARSIRAPTRFYSRDEVESLKVLNTSSDVCPGWTGNTAGVYGNDYGSYARFVKKILRYENINKTEIVPITRNEHSITNRSSGSVLPSIQLQMSDAFGQGPAIGVNDDIVAATMTSESLFDGSLNVFLENGTGVFAGIAPYRQPGRYRLEIEFSEASLQKFVITVEVRKCKVGETRVANGTVCQPCSIDTYNVSPDDTEGCLPCPANGDCTTNLIKPRAGYWIQSPCSNKTQRCLTKSACDFDDRDELVNSVAEKLESCDFGETFLEDYMDVQCKDGYGGPLCGSCKLGYGRSQSFACEECFTGFANATLVVLSILILFMISGITVRGSSTSRPREAAAVRSNSRSIAGFSRSRASMRHARMVEMVEIGETEAAPEIQPSPASTVAENKPLSEQAELSKWKAAELFKITINNLQVTAVAISINVEWQRPLPNMFKAADFLSGVTAEVTSRSVDCLVPDESSIPRSVFRVVVSLLIPVIVVFLYFVLWMAVRLNKGESFAYLLKKSLLSAIAVLYVSYISLTRILTNILHCVDVSRDFEQSAVQQSRRWIEDTTVHCYHGSHALLAGAVGYPFLVMFSLGFPITLACVFIFRVKENANSGWIYETAGFMYRAYSPHLVFWESIVMLRKGVLAIIVVFAYPLGGNLQGILGTFVLVMALYFQTVFSPYRSEFDILNKIEGLSLLVSLATFVSSLFFNDDNVPTGVRTSITVGVLFCNLALFLFFVGLFTRFYVDHLKCRLQADGVEFDPNGGVPHVLWFYCHHESTAIVSSLKRRFICGEKTNTAAQADA